jgi:hypothetical protein
MDWLALLFNMWVFISFALYSNKACSLINPNSALASGADSNLSTGFFLFIWRSPFSG